MPRFEGLFSKYREDRKLFIETGFHMGGSITQAFNEGFTTYKGCELDDYLFSKTFEKITGLGKNVELWHCDSDKFLSEVLIKEPAVFWLDAHYSGTGTAGEGRPDPIVQELTLLGKLNFDPKVYQGHKHIILVDDCRGRWGQIEQLAQLYFGNISWEADSYDPRDIAVIRIGI